MDIRRDTALCFAAGCYAAEDHHHVPSQALLSQQPRFFWPPRAPHPLFKHEAQPWVIASSTGHQLRGRHMSQGQEQSLLVSVPLSALPGDPGPHESTLQEHREDRFQPK